MNELTEAVHARSRVRGPFQRVGLTLWIPSGNGELHLVSGTKRMRGMRIRRTRTGTVFAKESVAQSIRGERSSASVVIDVGAGERRNTFVSLGARTLGARTAV